MSNTNLYPTINETHKRTGLSVYSLRKGVKEGTIPYIMCGNRVRINITMLLDILNAQSASRLSAK